MSAAPVVTLSDVLVSLRALLIAVGDARDPVTNPGGVEILFGEKHLGENGSPPRIVFVQDVGELGGALAVGARQVAGVTESVDCYAWGAETPDDATRIAAAVALVVRLVNCFKASAPGRLTGGTMERITGTHVTTAGEEFKLSYKYAWGVPYDQEIWDAAYSAAPSPPQSPPDPDRPQGDTGITFTLSSSNANTRP